MFSRFQNTRKAINSLLFTSVRIAPKYKFDVGVVAPFADAIKAEVGDLHQKLGLGIPIPGIGLIFFFMGLGLN